jgi:quinol monooxygenase YgiN
VADDLKLTIVTLTFDAQPGKATDLLAVLARYVVLARQEDGCRNIDLVQSVTQQDRYLVVEKWESPEAQRAHFDAEPMVTMARSCDGLLAGRPEIDLYVGLSAHDLN